MKKERDERLLELEAREKVDDNRNTRKTGLIELELRVIRERRAQEQAARDNPVPAPVPPVHAPPHVPAAPAADPALHRRYREVQSLHPGILGLNQSPEELRTFQNSFRNWYEILCLDTLPIPQQIFSLRKCCDLALQQKLTWDIFPDIDAALLSLTQAWITEYPIVVRRLEFLRNKQMQSEDYEEFVLRATQLYLNADIATMTPVQLQKLNIISGLRDSKLQVKLLELPAGATMADLDTRTLPTLPRRKNWGVQHLSTEHKKWTHPKLAGNVVKMGTYALTVGQRIFIVQNVRYLVLMSRALAETMREADHLVVAGTILAVEILHVDVTDKEMTAEGGKTVEDKLPDGETDLTAGDNLTVGMTTTNFHFHFESTFTFIL